MAGFDDLVNARAPDLELLEGELRDAANWTDLPVVEAAQVPRLSDDDAAGYRERLRVNGWLRLDDVFPGAAVVNDAVQRVTRRGLPPIFAYLYAETWRALQLSGLSPGLRALLGEGYRQLPRSWITIVRPVEGARGWEPHLDATRPAERMSDGRFDRLTVWIALTDATVDNGCIHVVPADRAGPFPSALFEEKQIESARALQLMHAVRALECRAGSALVWRTDVVHFGGWATGETSAPRVALAVHLVHEEAAVAGRERPLRDLLGPPPAHQARLAFIARQLLLYVEYPEQRAALARFVPLARRLLDG